MNIYANSHAGQVSDCHALAFSPEPLIRASEAAERCFLAELWFHPIDGNDAAVDAGLTGASFTSSEHSVIFAYACGCAEVGATPSVEQCADWSKDAVPAALVRVPELANLLLTTATTPGAVSLYADSVADCKSQRDRVAKLSRELATLTTVEPVRARTKPPTETSIRPRKGRHVRV